MKQVFYCILFICLSIAVSAQSSSNQKRFSFPKQATINLENITQDFSPALLRDWVKVPQNTFQISLRDVSAGIYYLKILGNKGTNITKKIIKN